MKKKIITAISAIAIFASGVTAGIFLPDVTANADLSFNFDVNNDGKINVSDLIFLKNYMITNVKKEITDYNVKIIRTEHIDGLDDMEIVINSYDELADFAEKCGYSDFKTIYDEEYFTTKSLIAICVESDYYSYYDFCTITTDNQVLNANLDIEVNSNLNIYNTDIVFLEYNKSDFSGTQCNISRFEISLDSTVPVTESKPVIYLYPEKETAVNVKLNYNGILSCTYPQYPEETGWNVTAMPDGTVYNEDGLEYSYLYWEGISDIEYDMSKGFVVKGEDTAEFLREKLSYMGLTPKEYNEFIVYWLPRMQNNKYNLISFQGKEYTDNAVLDITPKPDSMLRIFMKYKPLDEYIEIPEQKLDTFERKGFAVVEWGGSEYTSDIME
ncbi:MAG: hypothetical protein ACI4JM_08545 [Oscillospiraceae bacterium]